MLEEKKEFDVAVFQKNDGLNVSYEIKDFDQTKELAQNIIDSFVVTVIQNDDDNKKAKEFRANCNKAKDKLKNLRLATIKDVMGTFESQIKELEKMFDDKQKEIGVEVNAYADSKKTEKTLVKTEKKSLKLTFEYSDKLLQKILDFCTKNSITVEEI